VLRWQLAAAAALLLATAFSGALAVVAFGWEAIDVGLQGSFGAVVWGSVAFLTHTRRELPTRLTVVPAAAEGAKLEVYWRGKAPLAMVLAFPAFFALTWFADQWGLGPFFVPGQVAGYAVAEIFGAVTVSRWQREHGRQLLSRMVDGDVELFARSTRPTH